MASEFNRHPKHRAYRLILSGLIFVATAGSARATDLSEIKELLATGSVQKAIDQLSVEVEANPAHEAARILLAQAYESAQRSEDAIRVWEELLVLSRRESNRHIGRKSLARLRRVQLDQAALSDATAHGERDDPFKIVMPAGSLDGLDQIDDGGFLPAVFPGGPEVPVFLWETEHFSVYSSNDRLSKEIGRRAEAYLDFMTEKLFGGRSWAVRFPILVYKDKADYDSHSKIKGSGGVTFSHISGKTTAILIYQNGNSGGGGSNLCKYCIESVLPHELTHAVINEFFQGRSAPRWLHEAIARRFEQTRDHYEQTARLARKVVAGEFFRLRDLFAQTTYPKRVGLFYEQSAAIVLYLFEAGPEAMNVFLTELAAGNSHDVAIAAALGIPVEFAVEEFESRWVEWMKLRYVYDLDREADGTVTSDASKTDAFVAQPWVNEVDTFEKLEGWRSVNLDSLDAFANVGASRDEWSTASGKLIAKPTSDDLATMLAIRINESPPLAIRCRIKCLSNLGDKNRWFGFVQLDGDLNDTRVTALAPLRNNSSHTLVCLWSDDLAVYLDGECVGRYPATFVTGDAPDIEYPIAFIAYGPVEIQDLEVARITEFSSAPVANASRSDNTSQNRNRPARRSSRRRRP